MNLAEPESFDPIAALRRVEALHRPLVEDLDSDPRCWEDGDRWPCATARALAPQADR